MIGKTVSHYKITRELGAGGMGVVYEAVDTKLDRTVALKFLPPESTRDPDAKARFVHEAKAASAIDHPNVCNIYEIDETDDGQLFLAMACYEGETLKECIERGPLPLEDALDIARQVAEGLAKAHERDIVHRDIKPANIFITSDGVVKVLDFGLAKLAWLTQLTQEGTTLGTAHYMSSEQAAGQLVDNRSDLWSLGVVLFEMITGGVPFQGEHAQAVTYAILNCDPEPVTGLRTGVPLELERIIEKCLAKNPDRRYQHVEDLIVDLKRLKGAGMTGKRSTRRRSAGAVPLRRFTSWKVPLVIGSLFFLASLTLAAMFGETLWFRQKDNFSITKFTIPLYPGEFPSWDHNLGLAISRDGAQLVYVINSADTSHLVLRQLDQLEDRLLAGTDGARDPFFCPKGQWIGFFAHNKMKKISLADETILTLCDAPNPRGAAWGEDGTIVLACGDELGLQEVPSTGGIPQPISQTQMDTGQPRCRWPIFLPEGKGLLATRWTGFSYESPTIVQIAGEVDQMVELVENGRRPVGVAQDHLLFVRTHSLMAVPFNPDRMEVTGQSFMVEDRCGFQSALSENGTLVKIAESNKSMFEQKHTLVWVGRSGEVDTVQVAPGPYWFPVISPDGESLAVTYLLEKGIEIRILDLKRGTFRPLTENSFDHAPVWSPDGSRIAFSSGEGEAPNIFVRESDGLGEVTRLTTSNFHQDPVSWSHDGRILTFVDFVDEYSRDINLIEFSGSEPQVKSFLETRFDERHPMISPDGRWVAYTLSAGDQPEVYLRPLSGSGPAIQISHRGGSDPLWSHDGSGLFFWTWGEISEGQASSLNTLVFSRIDPRTGQPDRDQEILFQHNWVYHEAGRPHYDLHPDNQRFIMLESEITVPENLELTLGWFQRLRSLIK